MWPFGAVSHDGLLEAQATTMVTSEMAEKVQRLLAENRVALVVGYEGKAAVVCGDSGWWTVRARPDGLECDCDRGHTLIGDSIDGYCSHMLAAMCVWADAQADAFNPAVQYMDAA